MTRHSKVPVVLISMSNINDRRDSLLKMTADALCGVRAEIEKAQRGEEALDGLQQLAFMEKKLGEINEVLQQENWCEAPKAKSGMARLVVDTWPIRDTLGDLITEIEYAYQRLK